MQVDDRAPVPPSEEALRVERVTESILARFEAALVVRLPFADDRARVPELGREARPAVASLHFALSVEIEGDEASIEHHEGLAMIHLLGRRAAVLGRVVDRHPGTVALRTAIGGRRVLPMPLGEQLPRIC